MFSVTIDSSIVGKMMMISDHDHHHSNGNDNNDLR